jgi:beta-galactosidase/beta-glucuronidase
MISRTSAGAMASVRCLVVSLAMLAASGSLAQTEPKPAKSDTVFTGAITTRWGRAVTPNNAWRDYPRPQLRRSDWLNLNGRWDYAITKAGVAAPAKMDGVILVPFPVESRLSGVARAVRQDDRLWYRRRFTVPAGWAGNRVMLNFGGIDFEATIWVNGAVVGSHRGGFDAFGVDITDALHPGDNELLVEVADPTSAGSQPRGKQSLTPSSIWYTAVTGIWQTVWLEPVPSLHIADLHATPDIDRGVIDVEAALSASASDTDAVRVTARSGGRIVASTIVRANRRATLTIPAARLWSPEVPYLYDLSAELVTVRDPFAGAKDRDSAAYDARFNPREVDAYAHAEVVGLVRDRVDGYFAMRKISVGPGPVPGQPALLLNNKPYFQNGTLDQGWWPDGLWTPPSEEAMRYDIEFLRKSGFNMLRKHIKVEPALYYFDADRLGMLIWQDMPSGGGEDQFVTRTSTTQAVMPPDMMAENQDELTRMIGDLRSFPSIVMWVVNNEGWGQYDSATLASYVKGMDPSRLVNADSGWLDVAPGISDVLDIHTYEDVPNTPEHQSDRAIVIGEYGGIGLPVPGHVWRESKKNWGYQNATGMEDYLARFQKKMDVVIREARDNGLSAAVYTQTTDVEDEVNGLMTYDRAVAKAAPGKLSAIAAPLWHDNAGR